VLHIVYHMLVDAHVHAWPVWPERASFHGSIEYPSLGRVQNMTWLLDVTVPAWRQDIASVPGHDAVTFLVTSTRFYTVRGAQCTSVASDGFVFGPQQFQNFTLVSSGETIAGSLLDQWVGTFRGYSNTGNGWAQVVYCPSLGAHPANGPQLCRMPRLINIDEPGWYTEVKSFHTVVDGVPGGAFDLPPSCMPLQESSHAGDE